jgi:hypothetical protein
MSSMRWAVATFAMIVGWPIVITLLILWRTEWSPGATLLTAILVSVIGVISIMFVQMRRRP